MRAVLCKELGPPESLVVEDVPDLDALPGTVVIDVKAAGVNFPDTLVIQGQYQFKPELPFTPGGEVAGVVRQVGEGVTGVEVGQRVIGVTGTQGGFAQQARVGRAAVIPMPDSMPFEQGAGLVFTYGTSHYALRDRANLQPGETLLVLGAAGGVGLAAVQLGKAMGARVIAAASSKEKLEVCAASGADELIDYTNEDLRARLKDVAPDGVDVCYDPVGGEYAEAALRRMAWNGRFLVIGFTAGIPAIPLNLVLLKSCQIVGVFWGAFTMREPARNAELMAELLGWVADGTVAPHVSQTYSLEEVPRALNDVIERRVTGKAIVVP